MSENYYTQTKNFMSSVNDEVDPRTGLYSASLSLGNIVGNNGNGPEIPFTISYSPTSETNIGFGLGFTTGMTMYDSQKKRVTLNTGEHYVINENGNTISVRQMKLKTFVMTKTSSGYQVVHKSGITEVLGLVCQNLYLPVKIIGAFGHYLTLTWDGTHGTPRLTKVVDMDNDVHCAVDYLANTVFHFTPNNSEKYDITLTTQNNFLTALSHSSADITLTWNLAYTAGLMNNQILTGMTTPLGLKKSVVYQKDLMKFRPLPARKRCPPWSVTRSNRVWASQIWCVPIPTAAITILATAAAPPGMQTAITPIHCRAVMCTKARKRSWITPHRTRFPPAASTTTTT